jgi:Ca-activated chloride channel family protein
MRSSSGLRTILTLVLSTTLWSGISAQQSGPTSVFAAGQTGNAPAVSFRSSVNLVSISAVVRDRRGKVMASLGGEDFEIIDGGERRNVVDIYADASAPASVALLVDGSGSMGLGSAQASSGRISLDVLASLNPTRDAAALMTFDTRLVTICEFTRDFDKVQNGLSAVEAFGSTSLYDAIAGSAALVAERTRNRRAVIVLTDGLDNASTYSPEEVAWIASTIDVPVYVFAVGDQASDDVDSGKEPRGPLVDLARATGGDLFVANTPARIVAGVKRVTEELRHQYVIAFEASANRGLRRVEIRVRKPELRVQSRNWYQGPS